MVTLTTADDLADLLKIQLSTLSTLITEDGYELVCDQAAAELGWSYPVTNPTKAYWMLQRAIRHALNILRIASTKSFKYKLINLQQKFEHYQKMIETMDVEFSAAVSSDIALFAGMESYKMFGTKIDAGFAYDTDGTDLTYDWDRLVNFAPLENA